MVESGSHYRAAHPTPSFTDRSTEAQRGLEVKADCNLQAQDKEVHELKARWRLAFTVLRQ